MEKQALSYYEMKDRSESYFFRSAASSVSCILLFCLSFLLIAGMDLKLVGWIVITAAICCIFYAVYCAILSSYWMCVKLSNFLNGLLKQMPNGEKHTNNERHRGVSVKLLSFF